MTPRHRSVVLLAAACLGLLPGPAWAARERKARKQKAAPAAAPAPVTGCKEPAPADPQLRAGLDSYAAGDWAQAVTTLEAWAEAPTADADPAAARGLYALAYALRVTRGPESSLTALTRARPLLEARTATEPTLEGWYYLQGLHQMRGDTAAQIAAVSSALRAITEGGLCPTRDGDDWFRLARLHGFAGNGLEKSTSMRAAADAFAAAPPDAPRSPYRALAEKDLGDAAVTSNDLATAEEHLAAAARLDPTIPGVHRQLGLVLLRRGKIQEAADHWRANWKREREGGNMFMYALPIINKVLSCRAEPGLEPLTGLSQFTSPALEQSALAEGRRFLDLRSEQERAAAAEAPFPEDGRARMRAAECACVQYLLEYVTRGSDIQEFALQNGLLPVIHGKGLPSR